MLITLALTCFLCVFQHWQVFNLHFYSLQLANKIVWNIIFILLTRRQSLKQTCSSLPPTQTFPQSSGGGSSCCVVMLCQTQPEHWQVWPMCGTAQLRSGCGVLLCTLLQSTLPCPTTTAVGVGYYIKYWLGYSDIVGKIFYFYSLICVKNWHFTGNLQLPSTGSGLNRMLAAAVLFWFFTSQWWKYYFLYV